MRQPKLAQTFRDAAKSVERYGYAVCVTLRNHHEALEQFRDMFHHDAVRAGGNDARCAYWMTNIVAPERNPLGTNYDDPEARAGRVLALCFMAAMAESGDL